MKYSISIIVPNYNHLQFLPKRLETIFNQTFQEFEVILLDDCSTDGSWEYLKQFYNHPKVSNCIRNEVNSGSPFKQWKKGLDLARYDWIWIAESDDFSELNFLDEMVLRIDSSVNVIFCKSDFVDIFGSVFSNDTVKYLNDKVNIPPVEFCYNGLDFIKKYLIFKNFVLNASSVVFRKQDFFPYEILNMQFSGDWYFWIFLLKNGNIKFLPHRYNKFRFHPNSTREFANFTIEDFKFKEYFKCIKFASIVSGVSIAYLFNNLMFDDLIKEYFKLRMKLGRMNIKTIFPSLPFFLYFQYYKYYFLSFKFILK